VRAATTAWARPHRPMSRAGRFVGSSFPPPTSPTRRPTSSGSIADALNMMTLNFRTLSMNKFREEDTIGKVKADSITSGVRIRSIEPAAGMPWTYQVFASKEIHRLNSQRIEHTERMVCRYQVRLVYSGRTQASSQWFAGRGFLGTANGRGAEH
jgi:hypothetical protein